MADIVLQKDILDLTQEVAASAYVSATAGGAGNNVAVTGLTIDRVALNVPRSVAFCIAFQASLSASQTLSILAPLIQHSPDGVTWTTLTTPTTPGVVSTGAATNHGAVRIGADLSAAYRYVRLNWTPDLSASGTDTAEIIATALFAGTNHVPAP